MDRSEPLVVGVLFPRSWDTRPADAVDADFRRLETLHPSIEVLELPYTEPHSLRSQRGAAPTADLRRLAPELSPDQRQAFGRVEVVLTIDLPFDTPGHAPNLRWVQGIGAGVSQLQSAGLEAGTVTLTSSSGTNSASISEFVIGRLLQVWKRFAELDRSQREHRWEPRYGRDVAGSTLGVIGLGAIGRDVARRARALGMIVLATRRTAEPGQIDDDVDELVPSSGMHDLLGRCDAVVAAMPETAETIDVFDAAAFAAMKPGAVFCNVGRGSAVVETDLIAALASGQLGAAVLDVTRTEPLPPADPLWDAPNIYLSPHSATAMDSYWSNVHALFRDNLRRYLAGESLRNVVPSSAASISSGQS
jgi:phosphoglycerate dehydrogenase-like enzyme